LMRLENTLSETSSLINMVRSLIGLPELHCGDHNHDINRIFYFKSYLFQFSFLNVYKSSIKIFSIKKINLDDKNNH